MSTLQPLSVGDFVKLVDFFNTDNLPVKCSDSIGIIINIRDTKYYSYPYIVKWLNDPEARGENYVYSANELIKLS
jgi:hypothetical protein